MPTLDLPDRLSRFLYSARDFNPAVGIKASVFSNAAPDGFSVFKTNNLSEYRIWRTEERYGRKGQSVLARFDLSVQQYFESSLAFMRSPPNPRHYDIFGMPISAAVARAKDLSRRQILCRDAKFYIAP